MRRALNSANTIARDFPTQRGKDSTTCFPALFGNCTAKPAYFTLGIVHDVTRANSPRRQLPQFTPILFPSIRPPKRSLDVTDPHRPSFSYTSNLDIFVITHEVNVYLRDRCAKKSSATPGNSNRAHLAVSTEIRKFHRSFMRVKISCAKVTVARSKRVPAKLYLGGCVAKTCETLGLTLMSTKN